MNHRNDELMTRAPDGLPPECQPAWRTDFPIDTPQDQYVARREFTKFLGLASLGFVVGQFWIIVQNWLGRRGAAGTPRTWIARQDQIPVGGALVFTYPDDVESCLLLRTAADSYVAYQQKCTHLSCAVTPDVRRQCLFCPCHHGSFDLATGRPLAGPPRRPLPLVHLEIADGSIYAVAVEHRTV